VRGALIAHGPAAEDPVALPDDDEPEDSLGPGERVRRLLRRG
jgi:hypothetical protein